MAWETSGYYRKLFYTLLMITGFVLFILLLLSATKLIFLLILASLIAIPLHNSGSWLERVLPWSTQVNVLIAAGIFFGLLVLLLWFVGPNLADRSDELVMVVSNSIDRSMDALNQTTVGQQLIERVDGQAETNLMAMLPDPVQAVSNLFESIVSPLFTVAVLYILGIMLAIRPGDYTQLVIRALPDNMRDNARETLRQIDRALGWWLLARTTSVFVIGTLTYIGLLILGTPLPLTLALLAGLLSFIPNIGPVLSLIPAVLVAASVNWQMVLYVLVLYALLQTLESYLITPYVEKRTVSLPPALTISVQSLLTLFVGLIGALVAAPLLVIMMILVKMLYYPYILNKEPDEINYHIG